MSERRILLCNVLPQAPAATGAHLCVPVRCMILITVDRALGAASVCDKDQIIFCQDNASLYAFDFTFNGFCHFLSIFDVKNNVGYFGVELELNPGILEIFLHRKNQGFVLVITRKFQCGEIRQTGNMVDKPLEVQLHLQSTVPVFKCKHCAPIQPERGIEHFLIEYILDGLVVQIFILCHKKLHDLHAALLA